MYNRVQQLTAGVLSRPSSEGKVYRDMMTGSVAITQFSEVIRIGGFLRLHTQAARKSGRCVQTEKGGENGVAIYPGNILGAGAP